MQRLRVSTIAAALTVLALLMVGVVLAQAPAAPAPLAQIATPLPVQARTTGGDYPRQVYISLAEQAVSHVMDMIQTTGRTGTTGTAGATGTTSGTPVAGAARLATPTTGLSLTATQPLAELVVNMRAVLGVSERALDDLEAMSTNAACPNLADDVRDADVALLDVQRAVRRAGSGAVTVEARLMNQLVRAQSNLQADMTCLTPSSTSGGLSVGTPSAVGTPGALRTPTAVTPSGTATVRPAASNPSGSSSASGNSPLDAISRFLQAMRDRLSGGSPTPTPTR
ncbi:MAG: hypothetical protein KIT87_25700 [Anaerolineae bacterium]|nr:hypothetical protein [Anaerolineae bacterium]